MTEKSKLNELLAETFDAYRDGLQNEVSPDVFDRLKREFVFHMTDWQDDLMTLNDLQTHPENWAPEDASKVIGGFLAHVIWHIKSAHRLLWDDIDASDAIAFVNELANDLR